MTVKEIANLIPTMQSIKLVDEDLKAMKKKSGVKEMTELGVKNLVGVSLIRATSSLTAGL